MKNWKITWQSGRTETVTASGYTQAHRKAHNRANWRQLGPIYSIVIQD